MCSKASESGKLPLGAKLNSCPLLADENVTPAVIEGLRSRGRDVRSCHPDLIGVDDVKVLAAAQAEGRVVLTDDLDFGTLAIRDGQPFIGIICVRPGHIRADAVLATFDAAMQDIEVESRFILVAERRAQTVHVRLRKLAAQP